MTISQNFQRIHPLVAVAAASVTLLSAVGIAAITGVLPTSRGEPSDAQTLQVQAEAAPKPVAAPVPPKQVRQAQHTAPATAAVAQGTANPPQSGAPAPAPVPAAKPVAQNSPVGIGVGAVIGGVIGNQMGSGDGKTLATIAGAIGGGYLGNEVAKNAKP